MNESAVIEGLDTLISDNIQSLMSGMTKGGGARLEPVITQSSLTPAVEYLYIAIDVTESVSQSLVAQGIANVKRPPREARYNVVIGITDQALIQQNEDQPYEKLHRDFRRFTDRISDLVEEQNWITGPDDQKYELLRSGATSDRVVRKRNLSGTYIDQETQGEYYIFYSQLDFTLIEKCPDPELLYS